MLVFYKGGHIIIGNGDIASVLPDRKDLLFFASGVSNSSETRFKEFWREANLLLDQPKDRHIVYFSSLSIFYKRSKYTLHKQRMEELVKSNFKHWTIIRLGNISWGSNPNTLINYLKAHPEAPIEDTYRYVIDKDEFLHWVSLIPKWNEIMNCPGRMMKVKEIKERYVDTRILEKQ